MGGLFKVCFYKVIYECMMFSNINNFVSNMLLFSYAYFLLSWLYLSLSPLHSMMLCNAPTVYYRL